MSYKTTRDDILRYVQDTYGIGPDWPWEGDEGTVLRHPDNRKWFALLMEIPIDRLGISEDRRVDVMNVKCDPAIIGSLRQEKGVFPAYHMNRSSWITILLDGTVPWSTAAMALDMSYELTAKKLRKVKKS